MQTNTGRSTPPGAGSPGTGRRVDLPWRRVGITGGLVGILCYVGPTVLALFGVISGATALAWGTDLYDGYASWFCGAGLLVLAGLVWWDPAPPRRLLRAGRACPAGPDPRGVGCRGRNLSRPLRAHDLAGDPRVTVPEAVVTVYTRPGCPFSAALRWQLRRLAVPVREIDIWADRAAAGVVRDITGGDETVPTVVVGTRAMVNPGVDKVRTALAEVAPHLQIAARRPTAGLVARGLAGPVLMLAVWTAVGLLEAGTVFHLGPALVAASWAVTARLDAARGLGFALGGILAAAGAALSTAALLLLPLLGAAAPPLPEAAFAVAGGAAVGVIVAGRGVPRRVGVDRDP